MKNLRLKLFVLLCAVFVVYSCNDLTVNEELLDNAPELKSASVEKNGYIVVLNDADLNAELSNLKGYEKKQTAVKAKTEKILKRAGITDGEIGHVYGTAIKGFSVKIPPGQLKQLENDPSVKYIQPDRIISLRLPLAVIKKKPTPTPPAQSIPWGVARVNGGNTYNGDNVAWIVDTGIDTDHPDLNVDVNRSRSFVITEPIPTVEDLNGHGTHVAGTVAAINDNIGVVGVAAGATVISCRVLDRSGTGSFSWTVAALDYIAEAGTAGDVVNMSLGPSSPYIDPAVDAAVEVVADLGINISIAAGNESDDCSLYSPAHNNGANIYTISACDINDNWAYFSNYGTPVDYCEPGYSIYSTYLNGGYATSSGTSMAAPHMAGILLWGTPAEDGTVNNDPDNNADPIGIVGGGTTPPENQAPNAGFTFTTNNLSVNFTDTSSDTDGNVVSWDWNFGDGGTSTEQNPVHTFNAAGTYNVSLTVKDDDNASDSYSTQLTVSEGSTGSDITLTASAYKVRGVRYVDLSWSNTTGANVDIKINGTTETTTANDGSETLNLGRISGTFIFTVCETDNSACSNEVTIVF